VASKDEKKAAIKKHKDARAALDANYEKELKAARANGQKYIGEETDEYLRLNRAVVDAEKDIAWYRR
jgi:hypothetical protein